MLFVVLCSLCQTGSQKVYASDISAGRRRKERMPMRLSHKEKIMLPMHRRFHIFPYSKYDKAQRWCMKVRRTSARQPAMRSAVNHTVSMPWARGPASLLSAVDDLPTLGRNMVPVSNVQFERHDGSSQSRFHPPRRLTQPSRTGRPGNNLARLSKHLRHMFGWPDCLTANTATTRRRRSAVFSC